MSIRQVLSHEIDQKMLSVSELSQASSVSKSGIQKILNGKTANPNRKTLRQLADALSIPYDTLLNSNTK